MCVCVCVMSFAFHGDVGSVICDRVRDVRKYAQLIISLRGSSDLPV